MTSVWKFNNTDLTEATGKWRAWDISGANDNPPLVVSVDANGIYYLDKLPKTFDQLRSELQSQSAKNPKLVLAINADEKAPWGKIVKVRDAAAEAKIKSLVAYTKETGKP